MCPTQDLSSLLLLSTQKYLTHFTTNKSLLSPPSASPLSQPKTPAVQRQGDPRASPPPATPRIQQQGECIEGRSGCESAACEHEGPSEQQLQQQQLQPTLPPLPSPCGISDKAVRGATGSAREPDCGVAPPVARNNERDSATSALVVLQLRWSSRCLHLPQRAVAAGLPQPALLLHTPTLDHLLLMEEWERECKTPVRGRLFCNE